jgi:hypothetical protein
VYEGQWGKGQYHGTGILTMPTGVVYKGTWENGEPLLTKQVQNSCSAVGDTVEIAVGTFKGEYGVVHTLNDSQGFYRIEMKGTLHFYKFEHFAKCTV